MRKIAFFLLLLCLGLSPLSVNAKSEKEYQEEIRLLKRRNTQLENKLEEVSADLKRSTSTVKMLKKQIAEITNEAEENVREVKETRAAMKQVKDQLKNLLEKQSEADAKKTEEQLAVSIQRIQQLEKDLKETKSEIKKQEETIKRLKKQKTGDDAEKLRKELESIQAELQKQQKQFKSTLELLQDREKQLKEAQATIQTLKKQVSSEAVKTSEKTEQRVAELEAMLSNVNAKLIGIAQEKSLLESQLKELQRKQQNRTKDAEIARLEGELRKAADYINARTAEVASLTKVKTDLESQLAEMTRAKTDLETRSAEMSTTKTGLESQLTEMTTAKTSLESRLAEMSTAKTDLESRLAESSDNLENQIREIERLKNEITRLQASLDESTRKNAQLTQEVAELKVELKETGSVPDAAKKRIQELVQELQDVKAQLDTQQRLETEYPKLQQEAAACRERLAELTKKQAEEQKRGESLQAQLRETQFALEQSRKELDAVTTRNLDLKSELQNEIALRQSQEQKFNEISARNTELERRYAEGARELEFKEQLLQKVLTEKSLLEKKFDEEGSPYETLQVQLEQAEAQNALLREQLAELRKPEIDLIEARNQVQVLQQQVSALNAQLMSRQDTIASTLPVASGYDGLSGSIRALFPREVFRGILGNTITILDWSVDGTKVAYQESDQQVERLWIFNTRTKQPIKLTEWRSFPSYGTSLSRFAWAPDNEHFLFATGYPGKYGLYLGNSSGLMRSPVLLSDNDVHFAWSPTRLQFAYFSGSNLIIQDVKGDSLPLQLGHVSGAAGTSLQWSPDGTIIAFSIKRESSFDIFTLRFSEGQPLLQTLVASPSDDILPSWSPDGRNVAFYVRSEKYDTKLAVTRVNRSRPPYIVAHNASLPPFSGPQWLTNTEILYVGEEHLSVSQNSIYAVDIATGRRSSAPMSILLVN